MKVFRKVFTLEHNENVPRPHRSCGTELMSTMSASKLHAVHDPLRREQQRGQGSVQVPVMEEEERDVRMTFDLRASSQVLRPLRNDISNAIAPLSDARQS